MKIHPPRALFLHYWGKRKITGLAMVRKSALDTPAE